MYLRTLPLKIYLDARICAVVHVWLSMLFAPCLQLFARKMLQTKQDGHSRAYVLISRKHRQHSDSFEQATLPAALLPNHNNARELEVKVWKFGLQLICRLDQVMCGLKQVSYKAES